MTRKFFRIGGLAIGLVLVACTMPPASTVPGGSIPASPVPAGPGAPSRDPAAPLPFTDPRQAGFFPEMRPLQPCVGQAVSLRGFNFSGSQRVTVWLQGDRPEPSSQGNSLEFVRYAVKVADATVGSDGGFTTTFTLASRMAPVVTGGYLDVVPGGSYTLVIRDDSPLGSGERSIGFQMASAEACGAVSAAPEAPPSMRLEPMSPCDGEPVTLRGQGFAAERVTLEFKAEVTRFGDGPSRTVTVPVAAGKFEHGFRLQDFLDEQGQPFFREGGRYVVRAFDTVKNRQVEAALPICNRALQAALEAPSIPLALGVGAGASMPEQAPTAENAVIRSQAELEAFGARHHLGSELMARLPKLDFASEQGLMVLVPRAGRDRWAEIVAVEPLADHFQVHLVAWDIPSSLAPEGFAFHYVPMPRSDKPVSFSPVAQGFATQRELLKPALKERQIPWL